MVLIFEFKVLLLVLSLILEFGPNKIISIQTFASKYVNI